MSVKSHYDRKHHSLFLNVDDFALLRLHRDYNISFIKRIDLKLSQQYVDSFRVSKRMRRLIYRLNFSSYWRIHSIFTIIQLELASLLDFDSYKRDRSNHSIFVFVEDDSKRIKLYEIERLIDKRQSARDDEYLLRWKEYDFEWDEWRNLSKLDDAMNLVRQYNQIRQETLFLLERLNRDILSKTFNRNLFINVIILSSLTTSSRNSFVDEFFNFVNRKFAIVVQKLLSSNFISTSSKSFISAIVNLSKQDFFLSSILLR